MKLGQPEKIDPRDRTDPDFEFVADRSFEVWISERYRAKIDCPDAKGYPFRTESNPMIR